MSIFASMKWIEAYACAWWAVFCSLSVASLTVPWCWLWCYQLFPWASVNPWRVLFLFYFIFLLFSFCGTVILILSFCIFLFAVSWPHCCNLSQVSTILISIISFCKNCLFVVLYWWLISSCLFIFSFHIGHAHIWSCTVFQYKLTVVLWLCSSSQM